MLSRATSRWFGLVAIASVSIGMAGCAGEPRDGGDSGPTTDAAAEPAGGEHAGVEGGGERERSEAGGEHVRSEGRGEHDEGGEDGHDEAGEGEGGEGEESGVYIDKDETWDVVRRGARLVLAFDPAADAFVGTVENTTEATLCAIRVEVHLAGGIELGPTERTNVRSGATTEIRLPTEGQSFESWTAHPEMSACS